MPRPVLFDSFAYARKLDAAGFPGTQAEALAEAQSVAYGVFQIRVGGDTFVHHERYRGTA